MSVRWLRDDCSLVSHNHLISNKGEWSNCDVKNNQEIVLDLDDFALHNQKTTIVAIFRAWFSGSYGMAAKPIKSLK